jgi:thiol-disulfide isomerase/thioredoxin
MFSQEGIPAPLRMAVILDQVKTLAALSTLLAVAALAAAAPKAELSAKTLDGRKVHLKDLRGKLVVLNFWATWCAPCRAEMPMLIAAAKANRNPDLEFIAVSVDDAGTLARVGPAAQKFGIPFPVWVGANVDDVHRLSRADAVPATVFIDRDGTIVARVSGEIRKDELDARIGWLSGARSGAKPKEFISHVN